MNRYPVYCEMQRNSCILVTDRERIPVITQPDKKMNYDAITEAAIEAANEAIQELTVYSVDAGVIEEAVEEAIHEAIEKDREERKSEQPFTYSELLDLRLGIDALRRQDIKDRAAQFSVALEFDIDLASEKWMAFKFKREEDLRALDQKMRQLLDNLTAK